MSPCGLRRREVPEPSGPFSSHAHHLKMDPKKSQEAGDSGCALVTHSRSGDTPRYVPTASGTVGVLLLDKNIWLEVLISCGLGKVTYVVSSSVRSSY